MKLISLLKSLITYKEPKPYDQFELLEDEECEKKNDPTTVKEAKAQGDHSGTSKTSGSSGQSQSDAASGQQDQGQEQEQGQELSGSNKSEQKSSGQESQNMKNDPRPNQNPESKPLKPLSFEEWNSMRQSGMKQDAADYNTSTDSGSKDNGDTGSAKKKASDSKKSGEPSGSGKNEGGGKGKHPISKDLQTNLRTIKQELNSPTNQDVVIREFKVMQKCDAFLVFIDGMADNGTINDYILRQLMARPFGQSEGSSCKEEPKKGDSGSSNQEESSKTLVRQDETKNTNNADVCTVDFIAANLLSANQVTKFSDIDSAIKQVLNGLTAVFINGDNKCIIVETRGYESRSVTTPMTETIVKGPQEAFVENLRTNLTLIRKIIKSKDLITEITPIGKIDQVNCAIVYMKEIVNPKVVAEVKRRINNLDIDFAIGNGVLDQLIEDHPYSIFPQIISTERPDRTASFLMDGKVALICDGAPFASIVPVTFFHMFHTSEDSIIRWQYGNFLRYVRMFASFFAAFLPGLYIALTLYHKEMIPNELMVSLHKARENVPFPTVFEVLLMELSFEIIREAGIRVPGVVGQTLGIIGAIVLGQAAVSAGLVSPVLIIIVAITGLGSFTIPDFGLSFSIRIMRFIFIFLGAMAGFYGISAGMFVLGGYACSMKSFGVPYFAPIAPKTKSSPDVINRAPAWTQIERPDFLNTRNRKRGGNPVRKWTESEKGENPQ